MNQFSSASDRFAVNSDSIGESGASVPALSNLAHEAVFALSSPGEPGKKNLANIAERIAGNATEKSVDTYDYLRQFRLYEQTPPVTTGSLDPRLSLSDFVRMGVISDRAFPFPLNHEARMGHLMAACESVAVQILSQNEDRIFIAANPLDLERSVAPDMIIRLDGSIELRNQPTKPPLVIQFETPAQSTQSGEKAQANSRQVQAALELDQWIRGNNELKLEEEASKKQIEETNNRFNQPGSMSSSDARNFFPQQDRSNENPQNEPVDEVSLMDMLAFMSNPDKNAPYESVHRRSDGFAIGRYGMSAAIFMDWLSGLDEFGEVLGDPPDMSKLAALMAKLAKAKKVPASFAEKFKQKGFSEDFVQFLEKMQSGQGSIKDAEIKKFFPEELQEAAMKGVVEKAAKSGTDASVLALAMHLGKPVSKLNKDDIEDKHNQYYMQTALKILGFALARNQAGPDDRIDWKGSPKQNSDYDPQKQNRDRQNQNGDQSLNGSGKRDRSADDENPDSALAFSIANAAEKNARRTGTVGWCYRGVANTLSRFGVHLSGRSAYMAAPQLAKNEHFQEVSAQGELKKGTVLVFGPSAGHPHGHITVYLGNGKEASDHVQGLVNFKKYSGVRAFQPTA